MLTAKLSFVSTQNGQISVFSCFRRAASSENIYAAKRNNNCSCRTKKIRLFYVAKQKIKAYNVLQPFLHNALKNTFQLSKPVQTTLSNSHSRNEETPLVWQLKIRMPSETYHSTKRYLFGKTKLTVNRCRNFELYFSQLFFLFEIRIQTKLSPLSKVAPPNNFETHKTRLQFISMQKPNTSAKRWGFITL